nr:unnamed protein product [Callosobruchus chinensis]
MLLVSLNRLKICISSTKLLYRSLISNDFLKFISMYKTSQDSLELFFCSVSSHGGHDNNPTAKQFQSAYKKNLVHVEVRESFRGNCIPLKELPILKCDPVHQIIITSKEYLAYGIDIDDAIDELSATEESLKNSLNPSSQYPKYIITYIAGYVVFHLIVCEQCLGSLQSDKKIRKVFLIHLRMINIRKAFDK